MVKYNKFDSVYVCMYVCIYVFMYVSPLSLVQATGRTAWPKKMVNTSKDAVSGVDVPFGGHIDVRIYFGGHLPQKPPQFLGQ